MTVQDFPVFASRLAAMAEMFDRELSESLQALYFESLSDLSIEDVSRGIGICISQSSRFMPKPAEIREAITGGDQDRETESELAWLEYKRLARQVGGYGSPTFEDGALGATIAAVFVTWEQACWTDLSPEMWSAKRKEFGRVYRVMKQRGAEIKQLVGAVERDKFVKGASDTLKQIEGAVDEQSDLDFRGHIGALRRALRAKNPTWRADGDHPAEQCEEGAPAVQAVRGGAGADEHRTAAATAGEADAAAPLRARHAAD